MQRNRGGARCFALSQQGGKPMNAQRRMLAAMAAMGWAAGILAQEAPAPKAKDAGAGCPCPMMAEAKATPKAQTLCPVTGKPIDKQYFADVEGCRVYTCCPACVETIKAEPAKYLAKVRDRGECCECLCTVCPKCGEFQGSGKCCKPGTEKCAACGMDKGSPGCCKPSVLGKAVPCGLDPKACGRAPAGGCGAAARPMPCN